VPEAWRVPVRPWPRDSAAQRWASAAEYIGMIASPEIGTIERAFRWHIFSWFLSNLAAISYSDFVIDIDRLNDDLPYRQAVTGMLEDETGTAPDFTDLQKFSRYYAFEALDMAAVCEQVAATMRSALRDGRLEQTIRTLAAAEPTISAEQATEMLLDKIERSVAAMRSNHVEPVYVDAGAWAAIARKRRPLWSDPRVRLIAQRIYPLAAPIVRAARRIGAWH
jgi:hypothetical protein